MFKLPAIEVSLHWSRRCLPSRSSSASTSRLLRWSRCAREIQYPFHRWMGFVSRYFYSSTCSAFNVLQLIASPSGCKPWKCWGSTGVVMTARCIDTRPEGCSMGCEQKTTLLMQHIWQSWDSSLLGVWLHRIQMVRNVTSRTWWKPLG